MVTPASHPQRARAATAVPLHRRSSVQRWSYAPPTTFRNENKHENTTKHLKWWQRKLFCRLLTVCDARMPTFGIGPPDQPASQDSEKDGKCMRSSEKTSLLWHWRCFWVNRSNLRGAGSGEVFWSHAGHVEKWTIGRLRVSDTGSTRAGKHSQPCQKVATYRISCCASSNSSD